MQLARSAAWAAELWILLRKAGRYRNWPYRRLGHGDADTWDRKGTPPDPGRDRAGGLWPRRRISHRRANVQRVSGV
jgi:hypothetical protein